MDLRPVLLLAVALTLRGEEAWDGSAIPPALRPWLLPATPSLPPQVQGRTDAEIRAFHLYALALVSDWPQEAFPAPDSPLFIGVLGKDPIGPALDALETRTARGHRIQILRSRNLMELVQCHLLYIPPSEDQDLLPVLRALRFRPVLTAGEHEHHTQLGGIVRMTLADGGVRLEVNTRAAQEARLGFRSQFLKMVARVAY